MRFSTCSRSISASSRASTCSTRAGRSVISRISCFCSIFSAIWAAMVSTSRAGSSMLVSDASTSAGTFLPNCTYCSNWPSRLRVNTSASRASSADSSISATSARQCPSASTKRSIIPRCSPSTRTLTVPSGSLSNCNTVATVPTRYSASSAGSSSAGFFWATSRICLSPDIADSSASMDFSRPTNSGITMCGETTTSRSGKRGNSMVVFINSALRRPYGGKREKHALTTQDEGAIRKKQGSPGKCKGARRPLFRSRVRRCLGGRLAVLVNQKWLRGAFDHALVDDHLADVLLGRTLVHGIEQHPFQNRAQAASTCLALQRTPSYRLERIRTELQIDPFELEQLGV